MTLRKESMTLDCNVVDFFGEEEAYKMLREKTSEQIYGILRDGKIHAVQIISESLRNDMYNRAVATCVFDEKVLNTNQINLDMYTCPVCGKSVRRNLDMYCWNCGRKLCGHEERSDDDE